MSKDKKLIKKNVENILALTAIQEGMLYHYLADENSEEYFEQFSLNISGKIDLISFKATWKYIVQSNEMLRTIFAWKRLDNPVQIILSELEIPIVIHDLTGVAGTEAKYEQLQKLKISDREHKFDLENGPLLRIMLCKLQEDNYELIISNHHIIYDGWSNGIILQEFFNAYYQFIQHGKVNRSGKTKAKFQEFIKWTKNIDTHSQQNYWETYLAGYETKRLIPADTNQSSGEVKLTKHTYPISQECREEIEQFVKRERITQSIFFNAIWGILLQKYNNVDDVIFGTVVSGRPAEIQGIEEIVGLFINTIPLRVQVSSTEKVSTLLQRLQDDLQIRQQYENTSLVDIHKYSKLKNQNYLFDSILTIENYPLSQRVKTEESGLKVNSYSLLEQTNYDLAVEINTYENITISMMYNQERYDSTTIHRILDHFQNILTTIIQNVEVTVGQIVIVSEKERGLLTSFNSTVKNFGLEKTLSQLFAEQVVRTPDLLAVSYEDEKLTYREIDQRSDQLAGILQDIGVGLEDIVGIMLDRSCEMLISLLAILKVDGAYLPIDPDYPQERILYMLDDSDAKCLLTQNNFNVAEFPGEIIILDTIAEMDFRNLNQRIQCKANPQNLAYVMYTSGSTGNPKGVMVEHRSICNCISWMDSEFGLNPGDVVVQRTNLTFDPSVWEIFWPLSKGGQIKLLTTDQGKDAQYLLNLLEDNALTNKLQMMYCPASLITAMTYILKSRKNSIIKLPYLFIGAEPINMTVVKEFYQFFEGQMINTYGPTECTINNTYYYLYPEEQRERVPIGKPIANTQIYVLDKDLQLLPVNQPGEIYIGGVSLARGYINNATKTEQVFLEQPHIKGRIYKTGDLGRWLADGNIEFLGRVDYQVKIRGFRIELGEIENQLLTHEAVNEVVVITSENKSGDQVLIAYLKLTSTDKTGIIAEITDSELRDYLVKKLPEYMIPQYFIRLEEMPLTSNGKIDRKALPEILPTLERGTDYILVNDEQQAKLVDIWSELLGINSIGITDNFFELGGHSLLATRMISKILKEFNVELPIRIVFQNPTIKELSKIIQTEKHSVYTEIKAVSEAEDYSVSSAQKRMFILNQHNPHSTNYNVTGLFTLIGRVDQIRLTTALVELIFRHEALRTSFKMIHGELRQFISEDVEFQIESISNSTNFIRPFDLSVAPLFRVGLIEDGEQYQLLVDMHHIVSDGVSMEILLQEFVQIYQGQTLQKLTVQYKDYAVWQQEFVQSEVYQAKEKFWLTQFSDQLPVLNLPVDYQRPAVFNPRGARYTFTIDAELTSELKRIALNHHCTLYMVILAAYNLLLAKYTAQDDIIVGSPVAGRVHPDMQNVIGLFVNTLALRNYPVNSKSFSEFLQEVRERTLQAFEHQEFQFEDLIDRLDVPVDFSRNPVFDTLLAVQKNNSTLVLDSDLAIQTIEYYTNTSKFDLSLNVEEDAETLVCKLDYCLSLYKHSTMQRFAKHFLHLLQDIVQNPDNRLQDLSILTREEKDSLIYDYNQTQVEHSRDQSISDLFMQQVYKTPDKVAVIYQDKRLTYAELAIKVDQLAAYLQTKGVLSETIVAIIADRSFEMIFGLLAVLRAGGAYLPIDPTYPVERINYFLEDSQTRFLLTQRRYFATYPEIEEVIGLDEEKIYQDSGNMQQTEISSNSLAYLIYTSGSTGKPKGVMVEQRGLVNYIQWASKVYLPEGQVNFPFYSSLSFDLTVTSIYLPLTSGNAIVIYGNDEKLLIQQIVEDNLVEIIKLTPAHLRIMKDLDLTRSRLERLIVGGEQLTSELAQAIWDKFSGDIVIYNEYGPTETVVGCMIHKFDPEKDKSISVPIGRPADNVQIYVLDQGLQPAAIGVTGELYISGPGVARGYLHRSELTAERFVANPFIVGSRMYRTGDLARHLENGHIEFLGRADEQLKVRGYRIEPGEIEKYLISHPQIQEAIVLGRRDGVGEKYLVAYLLAEEELLVEELRRFMTKGLPAYLIPDYFVQLAEIPLTSNGKVNLRALPEPQDSLQSQVEYVALKGEFEINLAQIWTEILGVEQIGRKDNFFHLGGHSLKTMQLVNRLAKELELEVSLREIFSLPTLAEQAAYLKDLQKSTYSTISQIPEREYYLVSSAQKRMYLINQMMPNSLNYNITGGMILSGEVDRQKIGIVLKHLIQRHESLRTSFKHLNGEPVQVVHQDVEFELAYLEVEEEQLSETIEDLIRPFDLGTVPLFRASLIKFADRHLLLIDLHHIISDGLSSLILRKEFVALYDDKELVDLKLQYKDYACWQNQLYESKAISAQEEFWLKMFAGEIPGLNLPTDFPRPVVRDFTGDRVQFTVEGDLKSRLEEFSREHDLTLHMLLLATFNILLAKYTDQQEIVVGVPISGRTHPDLEQIVGMFVNTLAIKNTPAADKSVLKFLQEVKERSIQSYANQDYQLEMLLDELDLARDLGRNPLFDVVFTMESYQDEEYSGINLQIHSYDLEYTISKFDLSLLVTELTERIVLNFEYCTKLFKRSTIQRMSEHYLQLLRNIIFHSEVKISQIDLLSDTEKEQILLNFNHTRVPYPKTKTIGQLFAEQVTQTPDKVALVEADRLLTYAELNTKANQLAGVLRKKGVGRDDVVAILLNRSLEMIIGVLAIIKAGGAYLPIDLDYPESRIGYLLKDSQARILLTNTELKKEISSDIELLDVNAKQLYSGIARGLENINKPTDLLYIMYTSGSTGQPKGVMITHQNVNRLISNSNMLIIDRQDRILPTGSLAFDASTFEIWGGLLNGASLYLVTKEDILSIERFADILDSYQITMIWLTAPLFNQMVEANPLIFRGLHKLLVGGDALSPKHINLVRECCPDVTVINGYGPTENTTFTTYQIIDQKYESSIPIGKPVSNTQVYVLDRNLNLLPIGVYGELCIAGDGLARGYLNQPELNSEKFVDNPFQPGEKMYRSGDLVRWFADGTLEFKGRIDFQVKIRGFRVEPGELEKQLVEHPEIREVLIIVNQSESGEKYLSAYYTAQKQINTADLRSYLTAKLPDYMIPKYFVQLDLFPLTVNGKIDRQALPEPEVTGSTGVDYIAPETEIERKLIGIWSKILEIDQISVTDNFFALGGHSLSAMQLINNVYDQLEVELRLQEVFKHPTIRDQAELIARTEKHSSVQIIPIAKREYYPTSSAQKRMYLINELESVTANYNIPGGIIIRDEVDYSQITDIFKTLIQRHESLRTSFTIIDEEIVQIVHPEVEFAVEFLESREVTLAEIARDFVQPFELSQAPLLRVALTKLPNSYVLLYDMHHIIADGVSLDILRKEFVILYQGQELSEPTVQYKDYAVWQNEQLEWGEIIRQEQFWLEMFDEMHTGKEIPVLNLPTDYPRPAVNDYRGDKLQFRLEPSFQDKLTQIALKLDVTETMILLAAYYILLAKYSGQDDLVIGLPIAGRHRKELENVIGMFVNTLAIRTNPTSEKTVAEFLKELQNTALRAFENQDYQFEMLVERLDLKRHPDRNPLFDVLFSMEDMLNDSFDLSEYQMEPYPVVYQISRFDLVFTGIRESDGLDIFLQYRTNLYKRTTIERMSHHLTNLLQQMVDRPESKIAEIDFLAEDERTYLLFAVNNTKMVYPREKMISQLFADQAERDPDNIAAIFEDCVLSYGELNAKANSLARKLRQLGVIADQLVGIRVVRSPEMIVGIMAILKAGGAYLPIDPEYPESRVQFMLTDSNVSILLTQDSLKEQVSFHGQVLILEDQANYSANDANLELNNSTANLAYMIYTSGSTGKPKGVMIEHQSVVNRLYWMQKRYPIGKQDVILQKTPFTFDVSVWELFWWSFTGAKVYFLTPGAEKDPAKLVEVIVNQQITIMHFVPSMLGAFLDYLEYGTDLQRLNSLKQIFASGEALKPIQVQRFNQYLYHTNGTRLSNLYGPTEATVDVTYYDCPTDGEINLIPIGKPIANTRLYILNKDDQLQPIGVPGELCITGDGLARGYLRRPDLNSSRFTANPLNPEERIYRTGDLARWLADGNIEFLGRLDSQVKIRGFRIEIGEIDNQLLKHPDIQQAVTLVKEKDEGEKYLCAYIVADQSLTVAELRNYLAEELPQYVIPQYFVQLTELPLSPNGKINRPALPEPEEKIVTGIRFTPPSTRLETKLAEIWTEILGISGISIDENFFEVGGNSLKAMRLVNKIFKELGVKISLHDIFERSTIKRQAEYIQSKSKQTLTRIKKVTEREYYPVSSAQKRMFIINQLEIANTSYNVPGGLIIETTVEYEKINDIFQTLIQRHESLRTSFTVIDGELEQQIHQSVDFAVKFREVNQEGLSALVRAFIEPFDLGTAPLLRVLLVKLPDRYIILYDMHHIISDGMTLNILYKEFVTLFLDQKLPELSIQYKDFAVWQRQFFASDEIKAQEAYWLNIFTDDIPILDLPTDYPRPINKSYTGDYISFTISENLQAKLEQMIKTDRVTLNIALLAVFNILLAKYSGQADIVIGMPIAGRNHDELENVIGMFVNTLALRNYPERDLSFTEFLARVKETSLQAYENQDYQFEMLIDRLSLERDMSRNPLFDVVFAIQDMIEDNPALADLPIKPYTFDLNTTKFDLSLAAVEQDDCIKLDLQYSTDLFSRLTIEQMAKHFVNIVREVVDKPEIRLAEIDMLTPTEKQQLVVDFNDTFVEYPTDKTIHQLFEEQVKRNPDRAALSFEDQKLTYGELNAKANQLARVLRFKGVAVEEIVGVMLNRSMEMIISILAIIKAGGVYLPIDVDYPESRIRYMLEDAQVRVLLVTQESVSTLNYSGEIIHVDEQHIYQGDDTNLVNLNTAKNMIYIIYTSGSTGNPKGVMVEHNNVVRLFFNDKALFDFTADDVWTLFHSFCFDFSVWEMYGALLYGGKLVIIPKSLAQNTGQFRKVLQTEGVTVLNQTPTAFYNLIEVELTAERADLQIRYVIFGGEALKPIHLREWHLKYPGTRLINMYGITETTVHVTFKEITDYEMENNISNIGLPIPTLQLYILDQDLHLQPIGVAGELCVGGEGVARGYLNRSDLTRDRFVENPFVHGTRLYRSGDLAKRLPDGEIVYLGRIDRQVKIRGFRIELDEIENQLLKHPEIKEAVIVTREDLDNSKYLCAYIISKQKLQVLDIREYLAQNLPEYMIPSYFIQIDAFPLTATGKINHRALPKPVDNIKTGKEFVPPRSELEEILRSIWSEVLGVEQIGVYDNFFVLGGHSIKATQVVSLIHKRCDIEINLREIFQHPTIAALVVIIQNKQRSGYSDIQRLPDQDYYPLSFTQKRLWVINQLEPDSPAYNLFGRMRLIEKIDLEMVQHIFTKLLYRHESLRTSFSEINGHPVQIVHDQIDLTIDVEDLSDLSAAEQIAQVEGISKQEFLRPFDLEKAPLVRVKLVRLNESTFEIIYVMHHIITDGWSMEILKNDFWTLYLAFQNNQSVELAPLPIRYRDFVIWQNQLLADSEKFVQAQEFWRSQLVGEVPILNLPVDYSSTGIQGKESAAYRVVIDSEIQKKLNNLAKEQKASSFMVLLAGFNLFLAQVTGQKDILIGIPGAGREHENLQQLIGFFVNTLILREKISFEQTFIQLLQIVQQDTLQVLEYQNYPLEKVVEELKIPYPKISVFFNLFNLGETGSKKLDDLNAYHTDFSTDSKFDMELYLSEYANGIEIICAYYTGLFKPETVEYLMKQYVCLLGEICENPNGTLDAYSTTGKRRKLELKHGQMTTEIKDAAKRVDVLTELIEKRVAQNPDRVIVKTATQELTYDQLNCKANQIAHQILSMNCTVGSRVGLLFEQGVDMVSGLLGTLKSGKTYVPLDPNYPMERLSYILQDAQAEILITNTQNSSLADKVRKQLPGHLQVINLDQTGEQFADYNPKLGISEEQIAYILYTSGSTGKSKGVLQSQRNILHFINNYIEVFEISAEDRLTLFSAFTHDAAVMDIYAGLLTGATLYPLNMREEVNLMELVNWLQAEQITIWHSVPTVYRYFIRGLQGDEDLAALRLIILGGEQVVEHDLLRFKELFTDTLLANLYGQSESSLNSVELFQTDTPLGKITLGESVKETELLVVDELGVEVAPLGIGEIVIASNYLTPGYYKDPEKTSQAFSIENNLGRLYWTGDLGRKLLDGRIEFVGRKDFQVKIRGYRVELGEIESQLLSHQQIKAAAVIVREKGDGSKYLDAYIVPTDHITAVDVKAYLREYLPEYMIPLHIITLEKMPLTSTNKINRQVLPEYEEEQITGVEYIAPKRDIEKMLAQIWAEILQVDVSRIGIHDSFFDLGGNSLSIMELTSRVNDQFATGFKLVDLFNYNTIHRLVAVIGEEDGKEEEDDEILIFDL